VTPGGRRAVSASADQTLRLWGLESGQTIRPLEGHTGSVNAVAVTPDDKTLRLWDLESGKEIATFTGESDLGSRMGSCAVAPDGHTIIAGDESCRVHFLRLVEADKTKPAIGETKIRLLHPKRSS